MYACMYLYVFGMNACIAINAGTKSHRHAHTRDKLISACMRTHFCMHAHMCVVTSCMEWHQDMLAYSYPHACAHTCVHVYTHAHMHARACADAHIYIHHTHEATICIVHNMCTHMHTCTSAHVQMLISTHTTHTKQLYA